MSMARKPKDNLDRILFILGILIACGMICLTLTLLSVFGTPYG